MKPIAILEFPSNLGLKMPRKNHEPGVKKLPGWLKKYHFHDSIKPALVSGAKPPAYSGKVDSITGVRNSNEIIEYALQQENILKKTLVNGYFPIVIGGDCSIIIGNMLTLKNQGRYGLFFLDGHTDYMLPELSQTAGSAGMDLAIVTGHGHDKLANIQNQKPYVKEEWVWCVGNREYHEGYVQPILESKIGYYDLKRLRKEGIEKCVDSFIKMVNDQNLDGFWIHIDVDVLDDNIMPAVDSRSQDGLSYKEFLEILRPLVFNPKAKGLEITILDPELDPGGKYTREFVSVFSNLINQYTS